MGPSAGITRYSSDRTQGPACAISCPAALAYRNFLVPVLPNGSAAEEPAPESTPRGQAEVQLDTLFDVGKVVGNTNDKIWRMRNGYCMPRSAEALQTLSASLDASPDLSAR